MEFVAFVADEGEGYVGEVLGMGGMVLPLGGPEFESVVVDVQG